jgi:hypothetical protein
MNQRMPRRWLSFSLRSLFLLVLIVATYFAGWRSATWTAEREKAEAARKAVEESRSARPLKGLVSVSIGSGLVLGGFKEFTEASSVEELRLTLDGLRDASQATAADETPPLRPPQMQPEGKAKRHE